MHFERHTTTPEAARFFWRFHERQNFSTVLAQLAKFSIATPSFARRDVTVVTVVRASLACVDGPPATDAFSQPMYAHSVLSPAHAGFATMRSQHSRHLLRGTQDDGPPFPAS